MKLRYVALWIAALCILMFILQIAFSTEPFLLIKEKKLSEPWRLITAVFAHSNIEHLLSNLFSLILFGLILEGRIGARRVLVLFLASGILINIISPYDRSLGASGALFAIIGALIVLRPLMIVWLYSMPLPLFLAGIIWHAIDLFGVFYPQGIGNLAHLSGLFMGLALGIYWRRFRFLGDDHQKERGETQVL